MAVAGAFVGRIWGISGVAWAILAVLCIHFLLMVQLSVDLLGVRWRDTAKLAQPGVLLGGGSTVSAVVTGGSGATGPAGRSGAPRRCQGHAGHPPCLVAGDGATGARAA
jgi:hypothetical protein